MKNLDMVPAISANAVRAQGNHDLATYGLCAGCVYRSNPSGNCTASNEERSACTGFTQAMRREFIFIERTPEARAAYTALVLEYGTQEAR